MAFRNLTNLGKEYLAARLANELPVKFIKAKIGNGSVPLSTDPAQTTELYGFKKQVTILKAVQEQNSIKLTIQITNDGVNEGFYLKEIGIYVDDNGKEVLYWYCNEDNSQYINAQTDIPLSFEADIMMEVTNVNSTVVEWTGKDTWVNKEFLKDEMAKKLDKGAVSTEYDTAAKIEAKIKVAQETAKNAGNAANTKLPKGNLSAQIADAKGIYDLLENNSGSNFDPNLLFLNDPGTKQVGKIYFDKNKKGMFKCIKQTTGTVNSTEFFEDISNNANSDRLSNLSEKCWFSRTLKGINCNGIEYINTSDKIQEFKILSEGLYFISASNLLKINEKIHCYINDEWKAQSPWSNGRDPGGSTFAYVISLTKDDIIKIEFTSPNWSSDTSMCIFKIH